MTFPRIRLRFSGILKPDDPKASGYDHGVFGYGATESYFPRYSRGPANALRGGGEANLKLSARPDDALLRRINSNPHVLRGRPRIKGTRIAVHAILEMLACGLSVEEVLEEYPVLTPEDVRAALLYGARMSNYEWIELDVYDDPEDLAG